MTKPKKCENCSRFYVDEGYKNVCTSECWAKFEYSKIHGTNIRMAAIHEKDTDRMVTPTESNEKWLKRDFKKHKKELSQRNIEINETLGRGHVKKTDWKGKNYKAVRG